jgi:hypothetical protein
MRPTLTNSSFWSKTNVELHYILKDAQEAADAVRSHDPRAEDKYLEQICDAATVLHARKQGGH